MEKNKIKIRPYNDDYDDDNIPEIDLPRTTDVTPDEVPRRDGPGGEQDLRKDCRQAIFFQS